MRCVKISNHIPNRLVSVIGKRIRQLQKFSFNRDQFFELKERADEKDIMFLSTPFDIEVVEWLNPIVPAFKIASGDNDFWPLLEKIGLTGKPIILSLGLGRINDAAKISFLKFGLIQNAFLVLPFYIVWLATLLPMKRPILEYT